MSIDEVLANQRPWWVEQGDALSVLKTMPDGCIHVAMTSPPYFSLRDYQTGKWEGGDPSCDHKKRTAEGIARALSSSTLGPNRDGVSGQQTNSHQQEPWRGGVCGKCGARRIDQQLGLEDRHDCNGAFTGQPCGSCFICHLLAVFGEVKRVLRSDGVLVVNLGDSYAGVGKSGGGPQGQLWEKAGFKYVSSRGGAWMPPPPGLDTGSLLGIPWRFALAMQSQGWLLRSSVIWSKTSAMPESVNGWQWQRHRIKTRSVGNEANGRKRTPRTYDPAIGGQTFQQAEYEPCPGCPRCEPHGGYVLRKGAWRPTRSHEHVFIFAKSDKYWCDGDAVRTPAMPSTIGRDRYSRIAPPGSKSHVPSTSDHTGLHPQYSVAHDHETPTNPLGANLRDVLALSPEPCSIALIMQPSPGCSLHAGQPGPIYVDRPPSSWKRCKCERTSHFAAFPTQLCRPFLEAFCPARCCAECGTGWVRVVEREVIHVRPPENGYLAEAARRGESLKPGSMNHTGAGSLRDGFREGYNQTLGWRPACNCNSQAEPVLGVALDCFSGTGTLALTARRMGLRAIGIELSESYTILSRERLRRDNLLFSDMPPSVSQPEPEPEPDLFGSLED